MYWTLYLWLILQIFSSTAIFLALKLANVTKANQYNVLAINYLVAFIYPLIAIDPQVGMHLDNGNSLWSLWVACLIGLLFVITFILMLKSTEKVGVGLTSAFSKISVIIPVLVGMIFLGQTNHLTEKIIGLVLTIIAFYLILYKKDNKVLTPSTIILSLLVFFLSGIQDELQELGTRWCIITSNDRQIFMCVLFVTSFLICLILSIVDGVKHGFKFSWKSVLIGLLLGFSNYYFVELLMKNVDVFGGTIVFPIVNASTVLLTTIIGVLFFKEKITKKQWIGVAVAVIAVALIATAI